MKFLTFSLFINLIFSLGLFNQNSPTGEDLSWTEPRLDHTVILERMRITDQKGDEKVRPGQPFSPEKSFQERPMVALEFLHEIRIFIERLAKRAQLSLPQIPSVRPIIKAIEGPLYLVKQKMKEALNPNNEKIKLSSL